MKESETSKMSSLRRQHTLTHIQRILLSQMWQYQVSLDTWVKRTITAWFTISGSLLLWSFTAPYGSLLSFFTLGTTFSLFFSIWKCSFSLPTFHRFYDTLPAILTWTARLCLLSAEAGVRNGCVRRGGGGGRILWPANHESTALIIPWLSCGCVYHRKSDEVSVDGDHDWRTSSFQGIMVKKWNSKSVCVRKRERRGVITERATQGTRGRLAQWSRVAVVIVISGHHATPRYSQ